VKWSLIHRWTAALLGCAISTCGEGGTRTGAIDRQAAHGIPSFAQPAGRRPRRVRQPSRSLSQIDDGRAVGAPQKVDHQR